VWDGVSGTYGKGLRAGRPAGGEGSAASRLPSCRALMPPSAAASSRLTRAWRMRSALEKHALPIATASARTHAVSLLLTAPVTQLGDLGFEGTDTLIEIRYATETHQQTFEEKL
jgi:hypothetical protein